MLPIRASTSSVPSKIQANRSPTVSMAARSSSFGDQPTRTASARATNSSTTDRPTGSGRLEPEGRYPQDRLAGKSQRFSRRDEDVDLACRLEDPTHHLGGAFQHVLAVVDDEYPYVALVNEHARLLVDGADRNGQIRRNRKVSLATVVRTP
jgi:hypothetical protein